MNPIRLIALDLDGTLLDRDHETLSPQNRAALDAAVEKGIEIVVATGRSISAIAPQVLALPYIRYFITCNGSSVTDRAGTILRRAPLGPAVTDGILSHLCPDPRFVVQLCADGRMIVAEKDWLRREELHIPPYHLRAFTEGSGLVVPDLRDYAQQENIQVEKINLPYLPAEEKEAIRAWVRKNYGGETRMVSTMECNLEINDHLACKGWGLRQISELLDIPLAACAAFGDADNDIEMLQAAEIGVAMGNAIPETKAAADFVTKGNYESGVAYALHALSII